MKKVLIITYYWPPSGGSGVQRWLKHTKYLPEFGWQPYVFTPENPSFEVKDESLIDDVSPEVEVIKLPIWEPYRLFEKVKGKGNQQTDLVKRNKKTFINKLMLWLRGNLFIPDPRIFWVKPAVKVLEDLLVSNDINTIITTGPPHSMHLIGLKLKKKLGVNWIADFRDPWSQWELFDNFYLTGLAKRRHKKLEKAVLEKADKVLSVSPHYSADLAKLGGRSVETITNGFDEEEFKTAADEKPDEFIIRHIGVVDELRDPRPVLEAIKALSQGGVNCKLEFVGNVNQSLRAEILADEVLAKLVQFRPYVPHSEVFKVYRQSAVLLLVLANSRNAIGNIPGKLFEYLASRRPILAIGFSKGDSARIIEESGAGMAVERDDIDGIKKALLKLKAYYENDIDLENQGIEKYSRKNLTKSLAEQLEQL